MAVKTENHIQNGGGSNNSKSKLEDTTFSCENSPLTFQNGISDMKNSYGLSLNDKEIVEIKHGKRNDSFCEEEDNLDTEDKRFLFLKDVRISLKHNGGKLMFNNPLFLIDILSQCLSDRFPTTRSLAMDILSESIPSYGFDLDQHVGLLFPQLLQNLLHDNSAVRKSALQVLHVYFKHTSNKSAGLNHLINQGINNVENQLQNTVLMSVPHLIPLGFSKSDLEHLFTIILKEIQKRDNMDTSFPMVVALEHTKDCMDRLVFKKYLAGLNEELRHVYQYTMENSSLIKMKNGKVNQKGVRINTKVKQQSPQSAVIQSTKTIENDNVVYGFIPDEIIIKLKTENSWQARSEAVNELNEVIMLDINSERLRMHSRELLNYLSNLAEDSNLNVQLTALNILHKVILKISHQIKNHLDIILNIILRKFSDPKIVVRKITLRIALSLMHCLSPMVFIQTFIPFLKHKNTRTREEIINSVTAALLSFPSSEFDLVSLPKHLAPTLLDPKRRVRHASMECFAILAQQLGSGRLSPLVSAVNEVESRGGGEGVLIAVQTRLGRRTLPRINEEGLVSFALQVPSNISRGDKFAADVAWIIAGANSGGVSGGDTPRQGPESARFLSSAGRKKLPWQHPEFQEIESSRSIIGSAPAKTNQFHGDVETSEMSKKPLVQQEAWGSCGYVSNQLDSNLEKFMARTNANNDGKSFNRAESQGSYFEMYKTRMKKLKAAGLQADTTMINSIKPYTALPHAYNQHKNDNMRIESVRSPVEALSPVVSPAEEDSIKPCIMSPTETDKSMGMPFKPTLARSASKTKQRLRIRRDSDIDKNYSEESCLAHTLPKAKNDRRISLDGMTSPFPSRPTIHRTPSGRITNRPQQLGKLDTSGSNLKRMKKFSNSSPTLSSLNKQEVRTPDTGSPDQSRNHSPIIKSPRSNKVSNLSPLSSPRRSPLSRIAVQTKAESTSSLDSLEEQRTEPDHPGTPKLAKSAQEKLRKHQELRQSTDTLIIVNRKKENRLSRSLDTTDGLKNRLSFNRDDFTTGVKERDVKHIQNKEEKLRLTNGKQNSFTQEQERSSQPAQEYKTLNFDDIPVGNFKKRKKHRSPAHSDTSSMDIPLVRHAPKRDTDPFGKTEVDYTPEKVQETWKNDDFEDKQNLSFSLQSNTNFSNTSSPKAMPDNLEFVRSDSLEITGARVFHGHQRNNSSGLNDYQTIAKKEKNRSMAIDINNNHEDTQDLVIKGKKTKNSPRGMQPKIASSPQVSRRKVPRQSPSVHDEAISPPKTFSFTEVLEQEIANPQAALSNALELLATGSEEWESKCEGLVTLRRVCRFHADYMTDLHTIVTAVLKEVKNLRSQVTRLALNTIAELLVSVPKPIESELENILKTILPKSGDTNKFIREDVHTVLTNLVQYIHSTKAMAALISAGVSNKNDLIRSACSKCLADIAENIGPTRILTAHKDIVPVTGKLAVDRFEDTRYNARRILFLIRDNPELDRLLDKHLASVNVRLVRDIVENLRKKGYLEPPSSGSATLRKSMKNTLPSPGVNRRSRNVASASPAVKNQNNDSTPAQERNSGQRRRTQQNGVRQENTKNVQLDMSSLANLESKQWSERLQALDDFYDMVSTNPSLVATYPIKIFDKLCPRLNDSNSKVNLHALEILNGVIPLLKDRMAPTMTILIDNLKASLSSKNEAIYQTSKDCLITLTINIDNTYLVQPLVSSIQYGNSRNKPELADRLADIIQPVFSRKPGLINRLILPLVWNLLSTQTSGVVAPGRANLHHAIVRICKLLYECIGEELIDEAKLKGARAFQRLETMLDS